MSDTLSRAKKLFELGGHLGHRKNRLHPRARKHVYQIVDGVSVIDLEQTISQIDKAKEIISKAGPQGKTILVCATKKNIAHFALNAAEKAHAFFITAKWLPGLFTNFDTIAKNVKKLRTYREQKSSGAWAKFVKHEQVALEKEMKKLERLYAGIAEMTRIPDYILIIDTKREKNAVIEARKMSIPTIAIVDTNCNPDEVQYPIVMNDDSPEALEHLLTELLSAYKHTPKVVAPVVATPAPVVEEKSAEMAPKKASKSVKKEVKEEKTPEPVVEEKKGKTESPAKKALLKKATAKKAAAKKETTKKKSK
jgi:small subunit ribosomal protein S2